MNITNLLELKENILQKSNLTPEEFQEYCENIDALAKFHLLQIDRSNAVIQQLNELIRIVHEKNAPKDIIKPQ